MFMAEAGNTLNGFCVQTIRFFFWLFFFMPRCQLLNDKRKEMNLTTNLRH